MLCGWPRRRGSSSAMAKSLWGFSAGVVMNLYVWRRHWGYRGEKECVSDAVGVGVGSWGSGQRRCLRSNSRWRSKSSFEDGLTTETSLFQLSITLTTPWPDGSKQAWRLTYKDFHFVVVDVGLERMSDNSRKLRRTMRMVERDCWSRVDIILATLRVWLHVYNVGGWGFSLYLHEAYGNSVLDWEWSKIIRNFCMGHLE